MKPYACYALHTSRYMFCSRIVVAIDKWLSINSIIYGEQRGCMLTCKDSRKSTSSCVFSPGNGAIVWRTANRSCTVDSTVMAE
ncbi:hypothetical protein EPI10_028112 [Gossypium australe]|uniref:Uncharacterized protein n=1 Tax=Gossypium australe TaxID=47621 RepID=A0A5B6UUY8_9ROSI|nr:hypothetical protein EPI10_028112 [Gossypium australe]